MQKRLPRIGYLYTGTPFSDKELLYSEYLEDSIRALSGEPIKLLYDQSPCVEGVNPGNLLFVSDEERAGVLKHVRSVIKSQNIDGIIIPGNHYDIVGGVPSPDSARKRDKYTMALFQVAEELGVPEFGICGGLQAKVFYVCKGAGLMNVNEYLTSIGQQQETHVKSDEGATVQNITAFLEDHVHDIVVVPDNWFYTAAAHQVDGSNPTFKFNGKNSGLERIHVSAVSAHSLSCDIFPATSEKLEGHGLLIVGRSSSGIPEIIINAEEDARLQIHIQGHPEVIIDQNRPWHDLLRSTFIAAAERFRDAGRPLPLASFVDNASAVAKTAIKVTNRNC